MDNEETCDWCSRRFTTRRGFLIHAGIKHGLHKTPEEVNEYHQAWRKNRPPRSEHARFMLYDRVDVIKRDRGCIDCGYNEHACVLDFDHVRGKKIGSISKMLRTHSWNEVLKEIEKCEVRCANCHRIKTYVNGGINGS